MIVLDQDNGMFFVLYFLEKRVGKFLVDVVIVVPVLCPKDRACMRIVAQRPEPLISEAVVIAFFFLGTQPDPTQSVQRLLRGNLQPVMGVHRFHIGIAATMCYPRTVASAKD